MFGVGAELEFAMPAHPSSSFLASYGGVYCFGVGESWGGFIVLRDFENRGGGYCLGVGVS